MKESPWGRSLSICVTVDRISTVCASLFASHFSPRSIGGCAIAATLRPRFGLGAGSLQADNKTSAEQSNERYVFMDPVIDCQIVLFSQYHRGCLQRTATSDCSPALLASA